MRRNTRYLSLTEVSAAAGISRVKPLPPNGLRYVDGILMWDAPIDDSGITHFRLYADTDIDHVRELPRGTTRLQDNLTASVVFLSSYNRPLDLESEKVKLRTAISPAGTGSVIAFTLSGNTTVDGPVPTADGQDLWLLIRQPSSVATYTITLGTNFKVTTPPHNAVGYAFDEYASLHFKSYGGLWWPCAVGMIFL